MIRVVMRHVDDIEASLVGDFPPSEIDALIDRLRNTRIYWSDGAEDADLYQGEDGPLQWAVSDEARPRVVLEIILE